MSVRIAVPLAAAVLIAVAVASLWPSAEASASFSDMQEQIAKTKTVVYRQRVAVPRDGAQNAESEIGRVLILAPSKVRMEMEGGGYSLTDIQNERSMFVDPQNKLVTRFESLAPFGGNQSMLNIYEFFRDIREQAVRELPEREIGGKRLPGFLVRQEVDGAPIPEKITFEYQVWIDPQTRLPVRIEITSEDDAEEGSVVLDEFAFDQPLDEQLFSFEPPEGYEVQSFGTAALQDSPSDEDLQKPVVTPGVGIGPVTFGTTLNEVIEQFGEPDKRTPLGDRGSDLAYFSRGYGMSVIEPFGVTIINIYSQPFMAVKVREFKGQTDKGIRIGSTEEEVRKAYGEPSSVDDPDGPGRPKVLYYESLNGWFSLWQGKVHSMTFNIPREKKLEIYEKRKAAEQPE